MNLYKISWVSCGGFGLSAVVGAEAEQGAIAELELFEDDTEIQAQLIGAAVDGLFTGPTVVAREAL